MTGFAERGQNGITNGRNLLVGVEAGTRVSQHLNAANHGTRADKLSQGFMAVTNVIEFARITILFPETEREVDRILGGCLRNEAQHSKIPFTPLRSESRHADVSEPVYSHPIG